MSKPILVIKYPESFDANTAQYLGQATINIQEDYHLFLLKNSTNDYEFKVFNGEYTEDEFVSIRSLIEDLQQEDLKCRVKKIEQ